MVLGGERPCMREALHGRDPARPTKASGPTSSRPWPRPSVRRRGRGRPADGGRGRAARARSWPGSRRDPHRRAAAGRALPLRPGPAAGAAGIRLEDGLLVVDPTEDEEVAADPQAEVVLPSGCWRPGRAPGARSPGRPWPGWSGPSTGRRWRPGRGRCAASRPGAAPRRSGPRAADHVGGWGCCCPSGSRCAAAFSTTRGTATPSTGTPRGRSRCRGCWSRTSGQDGRGGRRPRRPLPGGHLPRHRQWSWRHHSVAGSCWPGGRWPAWASTPTSWRRGGPGSPPPPPGRDGRPGATWTTPAWSRAWLRPSGRRAACGCCTCSRWPTGWPPARRPGTTGRARWSPTWPPGSWTCWSGGAAVARRPRRCRGRADRAAPAGPGRPGRPPAGHPARLVPVHPGRGRRRRAGGGARAAGRPARARRGPLPARPVR